MERPEILAQNAEAGLSRVLQGFNTEHAQRLLSFERIYLSQIRMCRTDESTRCRIAGLILQGALPGTSHPEPAKCPALALVLKVRGE